MIVSTEQRRKQTFMPRRRAETKRVEEATPSQQELPFAEEAQRTKIRRKRSLYSENKNGGVVEKNHEFDSRSSALFEKRLRVWLEDVHFSLALTNNRYSMVSVKRNPGHYRVRLHICFLEADEEILKALARYIKNHEPRATQVLREYIRTQKSGTGLSSGGKKSAPVIHTKGLVYDLQEIFAELNQRYFGNEIQAAITWGRRGSSGRRQRTIRMGSYLLEEKLIRIHPSLDRPFVPRYFVAWIVYHEMLHQKHVIPMVKGRRRYHTESFLAEEKLFEEYERAKQWERNHLNQLLVY